MPVEDQRLPMPCRPSTDQGHAVAASTSRGHAGQNDVAARRDGHQRNRRVRPIPADHCIVAKSREARGSSGIRPSTSPGPSHCVATSLLWCTRAAASPSPASARTTLFGLFMDAVVSNSVSIRPRSGKFGPRRRPAPGRLPRPRQARSPPRRWSAALDWRMAWRSRHWTSTSDRGLLS